MTTFCDDARDDVPPFDLPPGTEDCGGNNHDQTADTRALRLSPRRTRGEMQRQTINFLCPRGRFLARGVSSLISSIGGTGKTRMILQGFKELEEGAPLFGCEWLRPERPMRCLYIGAEDREPFFNYLVAPLLTEDHQTLPFDVMLLPEVWPGFTLTPITARKLADFLEDYRRTHDGLDCVALDPMLSLIGREYADMMKNPVVSRAFYNDCIAPLLTSQAFALLTANHDSKAGAAVTGSADQQNAARCVLQLSTEGPTENGITTIAADRLKDNLGFRFGKLVLDRDPNTLLLTWNESASVFAYGAPAGQNAKPSTDPAAVMPYLCRLAAQLLTPHLAPAHERTKRRVEQRLTQHATRDGHRGAREKVRNCLTAYCEWQPEAPRQHQGRRLVLVGVRNPNAGIADFDDFLAGGPATDPADETPPCPE